MCLEEVEERRPPFSASSSLGICLKSTDSSGMGGNESVSGSSIAAFRMASKEKEMSFPSLFACSRKSSGLASGVGNGNPFESTNGSSEDMPLEDIEALLERVGL